jgi:hypothetical protein
MTNQLPIHELIESQQKRLGLRRSELARRCGFKNLSKGIRRIDGACHGDLASQGAKMVLDNLPAALEVGVDTVERVIVATAAIIADAERLAEAERDTAWRASFMFDNFDEWAAQRVIRQIQSSSANGGHSPNCDGRRN